MEETLPYEDLDVDLEETISYEDLDWDENDDSPDNTEAVPSDSVQGHLTEDFLAELDNWGLVQLFDEPPTTRSGRQRKTPARFDDFIC